MAAILPPEVSRSAPAAALSAPTATARLRTMPAHFIAHPLAVFLRHPLPPLGSLAVFLRHPLPLFAHFLAHLATLVRRYLRVHGPGDSRQGRQHEQHARHHPPDKHFHDLSRWTC